MTALNDNGCECVYYPVDASQAMLEIACSSADDADIETVGIKADISSPVHLVYAADAAEPPRLLIMSGNTMASFDPLAEIRYVAQCMKPDDRLLIDGEIYDEQQSMARRDNPMVRRFLSALLASVGIGEDDGEIKFNHKRDDRHPGLHLITRYFRASGRSDRHRRRPADRAAARRTDRLELPVHLHRRKPSTGSSPSTAAWRS